MNGAAQIQSFPGTQRRKICWWGGPEKWVKFVGTVACPVLSPPISLNNVPQINFHTWSLSPFQYPSPGTLWTSMLLRRQQSVLLSEIKTACRIIRSLALIRVFTGTSQNAATRDRNLEYSFTHPFSWILSSYIPVRGFVSMVGNILWN